MIQTEETPNPDSLKFLSKKIISTAGTEEFQKKDKNKISNNFIKNLLEVKGVELILLSDNFLTVKKDNKISWDAIKPTVISYMNDYFQKNNKPILSSKDENQNSNEDSNETIKKIK